MENPVPAQIVIERHTRRTFSSSGWSIGNPNDRRSSPATVALTTRKVTALRIGVENPARNFLVNTLSATVRITPIAPW